MNTKLSMVVARSIRLASWAAMFGLLTAPANASVIFAYSGTSSIGTPVSFEADITISGNTLTVQLFNNSPTNSLGPNDVLGSFYFDIVGNGNTRPNLTYSSAIGDVYLSSKNGPDTLQTANGNLKAVNANDHTWQHKNMNMASSPKCGFGIGTVGNQKLSPNSFNGNVVGGFDYSIYRNDIITQNLDGTLLVKNTATFMFTGVSGFTEANIVRTVAFGLGTAPDSLKTGTVIPEPGSVTLTMAGIVLLGVISRRQRD